jgi:hypothetical protein
MGHSGMLTALHGTQHYTCNRYLTARMPADATRRWCTAPLLLLVPLCCQPAASSAQPV